jgi:hypothetical protein
MKPARLAVHRATLSEPLWLGRAGARRSSGRLTYQQCGQRPWTVDLMLPQPLQWSGSASAARSRGVTSGRFAARKLPHQDPGHAAPDTKPARHVHCPGLRVVVGPLQKFTNFSLRQLTERDHNDVGRGRQ